VSRALSPASPLLQVQDLCFGWPGQALLFDRLTVALGPGVHLIRGDDGCGKSTLLSLLAGERPALSGQLLLAGASLQADAEAYRQRVFWVDPATDTFDTVDPRQVWDRLAERFAGFQPALASDLSDAFGLVPHLDKPLYMLSAGSKRKVWLVAAFASGAALTLIDQPFAALDAPSVRLLLDLLVEASEHPRRAFLLADYEAPDGIPLASAITL
jgi:ABC-type multidrug transport system ATPase subunit